MCRAGKAATGNAPTEEREEMIESVTKTSKACQALLHALKESKNPEVDAQENKQLIHSSAKAVALAVSEVVGASANLLPSGYVDMSDPNVVAERELLQAAAMVESSSKKIISPHQTEKHGKKVEGSNFDTQVLEAAKAIAMASSALIRYFYNINLKIAVRQMFNERLYRKLGRLVAKKICIITMEHGAKA